MENHTELSPQAAPLYISEAVVEQAIHWRIRLESGEFQSTDVQACKQWRQSDPLHELAWQRLQQMESAFHRVADQGSGDIAHAALLKTDTHFQHMSRRQALRKLGGAALSVAALSWMAHDQGMIHRLQADFSTGNAISHQVLQDHSDVWLNRESAIELAFSKDFRKVTLTRGEIRLSAADEVRPMLIKTPQTSISTRSAQVFVRNTSDHALIQVAKGQARIKPEFAGGSFNAYAGQTFRIAKSHIHELDNRRFDYSAWIDGVLSVRNMPLKDFLAELSVYRSGFMHCSPALENHLVSGVYQLRDTDLILQTLARSARAELRYRTRWWAEITT